MQSLAQAELHPRGRAGRAGVVPCETLRLVAKPSEAWRARRFADMIGAAFGLDREQRYDFTFAVNEAVSNAIEHGSPSSAGTIRLWAVEEDEALAFYVEDYGSFTAGVAADVRDRGRGLALIAAVVDDVNVSSRGGRTLVRLSTRR
jgi:anti-sigma regulatory factor (Ser/Thr protein kinase)